MTEATARRWRGPRFNAWGTLVAVLMLGTGTVGLGLVAAPLWAADMFTGVVLIAALSATVFQRSSTLRGQPGQPRQSGQFRRLTARFWSAS